MKSVLFIHRSVGRNLIKDGGVYDLAARTSPEFMFDDYDQNTDLLTSSSTSMPRQMNFRFPGGDTKPSDYASLFTEGTDLSYQDILVWALGYDVIVIKSCYPNSNITSDLELENIKGYYQAIAKFFAGHPDKKLVIMTTPPLRWLCTKPDAAARARQLSHWLATQQLGPNTSVFNFFDLLANPEHDPHPNVLYRKYNRPWIFDSHPNAEASKVIAPLFVEFLATEVD